MELTALIGDYSLMDIIGAVTGIPMIMAFLTDPNSPLAPFMVTVEALGELFLILPVVLLIGTPLVLLTEGLPGLQGIFDELSRVTDHLQFFFDVVVEWYSTHNWFTGQPLDPGVSEAVDLSGLEHLFSADTWEDIFTPGGVEDVLSVGPVAAVDVLSVDPVAAVDVLSVDPVAAVDVLSVGPVAAVDVLSVDPVGVEDVLSVDPVGVEDVLSVDPVGVEDVLSVDAAAVDPALPLDGFDAALTFIGLGDLID
ncbi:hypothetical protein A5715_02735 [Mycolicibacter heraklionensis]|nr:hypothetical protein A5715_02735 [Mycolicibacter heraklionensis]